MVPVFNSSSDLRSWLDHDAYGLWSGAGIDDATGTSWEALEHNGTPRKALNRRLRVQARQAFCFAQSPRDEHKQLAATLFRNAMERGFDAQTGHFADLWSPEIKIISAPHDLYDLAFMLLACAALLEVGQDVTADLLKLEESLALLKAERGWNETASRRLPRRQNPHMHLFEAMTALFKVTGEPRFAVHAGECLALFKDVFLQPSGVVHEFFNDDWSRQRDAAHAFEPGHMAEWVYLIHSFEAVTGQNTGVDVAKIFGAVLQGQNALGLLRDRSDQAGNTSRMWPQTELLKASIAMQERGALLPETAQPDFVLKTLAQHFLDTEVRGGWYDKRSEAGSLLSNNMPASSFYHLVLAINAYLAFNA